MTVFPSNHNRPQRRNYSSTSENNNSSNLNNFNHNNNISDNNNDSSSSINGANNLANSFNANNYPFPFDQQLGRHPAPLPLQDFHYPSTISPSHGRLPVTYIPCYYPIDFNPGYNYNYTPNITHSPVMEPSPDDMAVLQKLSNEYEPELKGPLVGPKLSTEVISQEYAQADPVYVAKTAALAESNSHYRVMKGDGNCGWRAVAFAYFENLFRTGDISKVAHELSRIKGFNQQLFAVGHEEHLFEIFVEATEEVFARIANAIEEESQDESFLVDAFNNEYNSSAIITHFRLMTSAWMRLNPERYAPFLQIPLEQYCASTIDTVKTEIDELGLQGLADGVIAASGFSLEVMYLDRSEGNEVTVHSLTPGNLPRPDFETITLLYRPGHYDILYGGSKGESSGTPAVNQCSTTFRYVPAHTSILPFQFSPALMTIPKLALVTPMGSYPPSPSEGYRSLELHVREGSCEPEPQTPRSFGKLPTPAPTSTTDLPIRMNPLMNAPMNHLPLTSLPFKNTHFNQAHFQNSEFQPSQWSPNEPPSTTRRLTDKPYVPRRFSRQ